MNKQKGQSLIEVVFSVGVLVLVITAVVGLIVKTVGIKTLANQRKKANEMAEVIVESMIDSKKNYPNDFWELKSMAAQTFPGYDGYQYSVNFTPVVGGNCSSTKTNCADAVIIVTWGNGQKLNINRFFSSEL